MQAKDGQQRQTSPDAESRPRNVRALVASLAILTSIGAFLAACGLALSPRRKRQPRPNATSTTDTPLQQLTRYRAADGTQSLHATLLAEFALGDRSTTLHVAFCPPFERLPTVDVEAIDDSMATVKLTQLLHNGVQIEVRLPRPPNVEQTVTIELLATDATDSEPL